MKRNSSTTMSVPTDIGDGRQYVLMSDELTDSLNFETERARDDGAWICSAKVHETIMNLTVHSIMRENDDLVICLEIGSLFEVFVEFLLGNLGPQLVVAGTPFKSKVLGLESGRAYLKILR